MRRSLAWSLAVVAVLVCAPRASAQTAADGCGAAPVAARGEPASYRWLALVKARGNWRTKVRGMQELGPTFANWSSAADQVERCIENTGSIVCTVCQCPVD